MKILKNKILKISAVVLTVALLSVSFALPKMSDAQDYCSYNIVYAAEDAEIPTIGAADSSESETSSEDTQNDAKGEAERQSNSTFFKWAIPITCVLSLILAVILAVRGANKRYGKEW
ncbi:MAG: hypothetical protein E7384_00495 [Ruminococcaceae bacterium]|nr:hypothetical protein [Oscillospiraceae bacterium]